MIVNSKGVFCNVAHFLSAFASKAGSAVFKASACNSKYSLKSAFVDKSEAFIKSLAISLNLS